MAASENEVETRPEERTYKPQTVPLSSGIWPPSFRYLDKGPTTTLPDEITKTMSPLTSQRAFGGCWDSLEQLPGARRAVAPAGHPGPRRVHTEGRRLHGEDLRNRTSNKKDTQKVQVPVFEDSGSKNH